MKFVKLLILFVLTACGQMEQNGEFNKVTTPGDPRPDSFIDPAIKPYYDQFFVIAKDFGVNVVSNTQIIRFVDRIGGSTPGYDVVGDCQSYYWVESVMSTAVEWYSQNRINVLRSAWEAAGPCLREGLIIHEAGHCDLGLGHSKNPESLMYPDLHIQEDSTCLDMRLKARVMFEEFLGIDPSK